MLLIGNIDFPILDLINNDLSCMRISRPVSWGSWYRCPVPGGWLHYENYLYAYAKSEKLRCCEL